MKLDLTVHPDTTRPLTTHYLGVIHSVKLFTHVIAWIADSEWTELALTERIVE